VTPTGLTGFVLRVGSKTPNVVARPRCALLSLGAPSALPDNFTRQLGRDPAHGGKRWYASTVRAVLTSAA
jgi:hypothetical protein